MHKRRGELVKAILSVRAALYHAAHDFPGGVPAVAGALGQHPSTLQNKLNIGQSVVLPTLKDFEGILHLTHDDRIVQALCAPVGYVAIRLGEYTASSDLELLDGVNQLVQRLGETTRDLSEALKDGRISHAEREALRGDGHRMIQALHELLARVDAIAEPPPAENITALRPGTLGRGGQA